MLSPKESFPALALLCLVDLTTCYQRQMTIYGFFSLMAGDLLLISYT